jgi:cell division protein FtsA
MSQQPEHLVALDVGNCMTRALIAQGHLAAGDYAARLRFLGFAETESEGWNKGVLADIAQVSAGVRHAVEAAQQQAGSLIESAVVGIGGPHLQGIASRAAVHLSSRPREVRREDVQRVLEAARDFRLPADRDILHLVPKEFVLDSLEGIRDPFGMLGMQLEVRVHVITHSAAAAQNLVTAVNRAGVLVETLVGEAYAAAEAIPTPEEQELGVLTVVLGGPSSTAIVCANGGLVLASDLPIGGDHFTGDLAIGLRTSRADAEMIKKTFGSVFPGWYHEGASFETPGIGRQPSRQIPHRALREILEPRARELFVLLRGELQRSGLYGRLAGGVILSGGAARLPGLCDLAEKVLDLPARIGLPPKIQGLPEELDSPEYAPLLSLLHYGARIRQQRLPRQGASAGRLRDLLARTR